MPHISKANIEEREPYQPVTRAELAYEIAAMVDDFVDRMSKHPHSKIRWHLLNEVEGVLAGLLNEWQRRVVGPYEQQKVIENGSAFPKVEQRLFPERNKLEQAERTKIKEKKKQPDLPPGITPEMYEAYLMNMGMGGWPA